MEGNEHDRIDLSPERFLVDPPKGLFNPWADTTFWDRDGNEVDPATFLRLRNDADYVHIARDEVGRNVVSTVWLGWDYNRGNGPLALFETAIFNEHDEASLIEHYANEEDARIGHARTVDSLHCRALPETWA